MKTQENVGFLFDVDNTRLENDRTVTDLGHHLAQKFGDESWNRYWQIFEAARLYPGALEVLDLRSDRIHAELGIVRGPTSELSRLGSASISARMAGG